MTSRLPNEESADGGEGRAKTAPPTKARERRQIGWIGERKRCQKQSLICQRPGGPEARNKGAGAWGGSLRAWGAGSWRGPRGWVLEGAKGLGWGGLNPQGTGWTFVRSDGRLFGRTFGRLDGRKIHPSVL